jgi:rubrerythrin
MTMLREVTSEKGLSVDMEPKLIDDRSGWLCPRCRTACSPMVQVCPNCNEVHTATEIFSRTPQARQVLLG